MSITEDDIREAAQHRPYEELDDQSLGALLDAFESSIEFSPRRHRPSGR